MWEFLRTLAEISVSVGAVTLLLSLLSSYFDKRFVAKWKYWVWLVLAIRLLIPVNAQFGALSLQLPAPQTELTLPQYIQQGRTARPAPDGAIEVPAITEPARAGADDPPERIAPAPQTPAKTSLWQCITLEQMLFALYLVGVAGFAAIQVVQYQAAKKRLLRWSYPANRTALQTMYRRVCDELAFERPVEMRFSKAVDSPLVVGLRKPVMLFPVRPYTEQELYFILRHELVHIRRHDLFYKLVLLMANALHWFNPAAYLMVREAGKDLEFACDDEVLRGLPTEARRVYSETILSVVGQGSATSLALSTQYSGGVDTLKARFRNILRRGEKRSGRAVGLLTLLCAGLLCGLVACGPAAEVPVDLSDLEAIGARYLAPAAAASITDYSWENPGEIAPDSLARYFLYTDAGVPYLDRGEMDIPADILEGEVLSHFAVTSDHLRTSSYYDAERRIYQFGLSVSGPATAVRNIALTDGMLTLDYVYYDDALDDVIIRKGTLGIEVSGNHFVYRNCRTETAPATADFYDVNTVVGRLWGANPAYVYIRGSRMEGRSLNLELGGTRVTGELLAQLANILSKHPPDRIHEIRADSSAPYLNFYWAKSGYSDPYSYMQLTRLEDDTYGARTILETGLEDEMPYYIYDGSVFDEIEAALQAASYAYPNTVQGKYTTVAVSLDDTFASSHVRQVGDRLVFVDPYRYDETNHDAYTHIDVVDAATGTTLHTARVEGMANRVDAASYGNYDYRIYTERGITLRSSTEPDDELFLGLPTSIAADLLNYSQAFYDMHPKSDLMVWRAADGIYQSRMDGSNAKRILKNADLVDLLSDEVRARNQEGLPYTEIGLSYVSPVIMNGGRSVAAYYFYGSSINIGGTRYTCGISVVDARSGAVEHITGLTTWSPNGVSRLDDHTLVAKRENGYHLVDVRTAETTFIPFDNETHYTGTSHDHNTYFETVTGRNENGELVHTLVSYTVEDASNQKVWLQIESQSAYIQAVTENYVVCDYYSPNGSGWLIVPYRT